MKQTLMLCALVLAAASPGAASDPDLGKLRFMTGCWVAEAGPVTIEEQWSRPAGGTMLGLSRTLKQGKTAFSEFMRIDHNGSEILYTPRFGTGQKPVLFRLVRQTDTGAVFENPAHDFPQRILYRKTDSGLFARIENMDRTRGQDFPYRRTSCE